MQDNSELEETWENLTFANNFLFCKIMESEPELCKQVLELLLEIKIDHLEYPVAERTFQENIDSKSVRFDVYTQDDNRIFDLEIQTTNKRNLPKRARYYQSIIDVENLYKGLNYTKLKDSYVIFLCLKDTFNKGLPVYFFENICRQNKNIRLNDRTFKVFFNASSCDKLLNEEQKNFFKFLKGQTANDDLTKKLEEKVLFAKKNSTWRHQFMTWQQTIDEEVEIAREEAYQDAYREAYHKAYHKKALDAARNLLSLNMLTIEQIAKVQGLSVEEVKSLALEKSQK